MSLIITKKKTLPNVAVITLPYKEGKVVEEKIGDLVLLKIDGTVVGINIFNYEKYFKAEEGVHTINKDQVDAIGGMGYIIPNPASMFSVGEVIERKVHPKTDKLFVLKVQTNKELNIVTNASNAKEGTKVVVANLGATLPSGMPIVRAKVMGIESQGMLCGGETLGKQKTKGVLLVEGENGSQFII